MSENRYEERTVILEEIREEISALNKSLENIHDVLLKITERM